MNDSSVDTLAQGRKIPRDVLIACTAGYCIANLGWWIQPELIAQLANAGQLTESQAGLIASVELAALAVSSVSLSRIPSLGSLRSVALTGGVVALVATLISIFSSTYLGVLIARVVVGLGEGAAFMAANVAVARFAKPDRVFGNMNVVNVLIGVALVSLLPLFKGLMGSTSALPALLLGLGVLTPLLWLMPASLRVERTQNIPVTGVAAVDAGRFNGLGLAWMLTASFFLVSVMSGAIWAFYALIGSRAGLSESAVSHAIAVSVMCALFGSAVAPLIGTRFGRILPVSIAIALEVTAIMVLCLSREPGAFRIATCVNVAALYVLQPYFFGAAAEDDPSGRAVAIIGGTYLVTGAIGPYLGGMLLENVGLRPMSLIVLVTCGAAWLAFIAVDIRLRRRAATPSRA